MLIDKEARGAHIHTWRLIYISRQPVVFPKYGHIYPRTTEYICTLSGMHTEGEGP